MPDNYKIPKIGEVTTEPEALAVEMQFVLRVVITEQTVYFNWPLAGEIVSGEDVWPWP